MERPHPSQYNLWGRLIYAGFQSATLVANHGRSVVGGAAWCDPGGGEEWSPWRLQTKYKAGMTMSVRMVELTIPPTVGKVEDEVSSERIARTFHLVAALRSLSHVM